MKKFRFAAKSADGKRITGIREVGDQSELYDRLREEGLFLVSCREIQSSSVSKRLNFVVRWELFLKQEFLWYARWPF